MADRDDAASPLRDLVTRARHGDPDAWEQLYRRAHPQLLAYARRRVHESAEDVVSETMSRALAKIDDFTWEGAGFEAWLTGICRNVCREHWRRDSRSTPVADPGLAVVDESSTTADAVASLDRDEALRLAFSRLSDDDRDVLELRVVSGLDSAAVGEVLGKRAGAVRMAQARALDRLRDQLGRLGHDD